MKKLIIVIIIILGAVILFYTVDSKSPEVTTITPTSNERESLRPDPSNATFIIDDESITLSAGRNEDASGEETILLDKLAYGDINADDKTDTALLLIRSGVGSGTFTYLGAYVSGLVTYRGSKTVFIGDRISPQSISMNKGIVTIKYLDRREGEAFTDEPTIPVSKQFIFANGEFVER